MPFSREFTAVLVSHICKPFSSFFLIKKKKEKERKICANFSGPEAVRQHTTYKSVRIVGDDYDLYYSVFCTNERELYDLTVCSKICPSPTHPTRAHPTIQPLMILDRSVRNEQSPQARIAARWVEDHPGLPAATRHLATRCAVAGVEVLSGPSLRGTMENPAF